VRDAYRDGVVTLWSLPAGEDDDGKPRAWRVLFTREADEVIRQLERDLEPRLAEGEDLSFLHGWAGKAAGGAVRIATVLHLAESAAKGAHRLDPVAVAVAERAVRLVRDYLVPHARAAFGLLGADPKVNRAKKLVRWFTARGLASFSVRDAHQAMKGSIRTVDDLLPILDLIERHHYIRQAGPGSRSGPGRPRSPRYEVNPEALGPPPGDRGGDSEDSGDFETPPPGPNPRPGGPGGGGPSAANGDTDGPQYPRNPGPDPAESNSEDTGDIETGEVGRGDGAAGGTGRGPGVRTAAQYSQYPQNGGRGDGPQAGPAGAAQYPQYPQNAAPLADGAGREQTGPGPGHTGAGYDGAVAADAPYLLVRNPGDLQAVVNAVAESRYVGLDAETTGLDPRADRLRLLTLDCETNDGGRFAYLVDAFAVDAGPLWEPLAGAEVVIHNAAFDLGFLGRLGFVPGRVHDTLLLSHVLYAGGHTRGVAPLRHGLKDCCRRELGVELAKDLQASDWAGPLAHDQLAYAATDASVLVPLYRALSEKLKADGLAGAAAVESAAIPCIVWLSASGVPFDAARWRALAKGAGEEALRAQAALDAAAPERPGTLFGEAWNWDSPDQVKEALALAGCTVESTADGVLAALDHPLATLLRDYREAQKRSTTYGDTWLKHVGPDGRVYPRWVQLGANSGRMACGSPNMQNLPRGAYRKCVAAPPGRVLVKADYSQVELRIAAKVSGDKALIAAYERGEDLHTLTARQVLGIAEVTKEHRQLAKALNFGLLYGMGANGFRNYARSHYGLELSEEQAVGYREAFFRAYPGLRRWHRSVGDARRDTRTLAGRRCLRVERFNEKLNLPVQGTGADGLKRALALLWERRAECPTAVPVLAVHDEVVVECSEGDSDLVATWLKRAMLDGMAPLVAPVPVGVDVKVARTWGGD
jgi:DNA polymerase-1